MDGLQNNLNASKGHIDLVLLIKRLVVKEAAATFLPLFIPNKSMTLSWKCVSSDQTDQ